MQQKTIALAVRRETSWKLALNSASNSLRAMAEALYGTEERTHRTLAAALLLGVLGALLSTAHHLQALQVCTY